MRSRWAPWTMISPSLTDPPTPQRCLSIRPSASKSAAVPRNPRTSVTTLPARGIVPDSDPKVLGMLGMHGTIAATGAVQRCDLLVAIGARFDDRVTGKLDAFAPGARVIHIDIDPAELN